MLLFFCAALAAVTTLSGNNLHILLLACLLSTWCVEVLLGNVNLQGITVRRNIEEDCYAQIPARGIYLLQNRRGGPMPREIYIDEGSGEASAYVTHLAPHSEVELRAQWLFSMRGRVRLERLRIRSSFPFGFVERTRWLSCPGEWMVFPQPLTGVSPVSQGMSDGDDARAGGTGGASEPYALRPYRDGDAFHHIHWATTARRDHPWVIERQSHIKDKLIVEVKAGQGAAWETEISRACGQVLWGFRCGYLVGLQVSGKTFDARSGRHWRTTLLEALALQPYGERP